MALAAADSDEENQLSSTWGSHDNVHKAFLGFKVRATKRGGSVDEFFSVPVCATEKLDGSNLGVHIRKEDGKWEPVCFQGRNKPLWEKASGRGKYSELGKYGNAGSLGKLPIKIFEFAQKVGDKLDVDELLVFGEAFRAPGAAFASWHPFGYKLPAAKQTVRLTRAVHQLFQEQCGVEPLKSHDECFAYLQAQKDHVVFPPPIFSTGTLGEVVDALYPMMKEAEGSHFEGCFLVAENAAVGFKWKRGEHEEQKSIPSLEDLGFAQASSAALYTKLADVFHSRPVMRVAPVAAAAAGNAKGKEKMPEEALLVAEITKAYERELSKAADFTHIPRAQRKHIAEELVKLVTKEVLSHYIDSNVAAPWTEKQVLDKAASLVTSKVMAAVPKP